MPRRHRTVSQESTHDIESERRNKQNKVWQSYAYVLAQWVGCTYLGSRKKSQMDTTNAQTLQEICSNGELCPMFQKIALEALSPAAKTGRKGSVLGAASALQLHSPCQLFLRGAELQKIVAAIAVDPSHCCTETLHELIAHLHLSRLCHRKPSADFAPDCFDRVQVLRALREILEDCDTRISQSIQ